MDFSWKTIEYRAKQSGDTYLVWLKTLNRYLNLEEPAYLVFKQFTEDLKTKDIIGNFAAEYKLPDAEAQRFVREIKYKFESLYQNHQEPENPQLYPPTPKLPFKSHSEKNIKVAGKCFCFTFGNSLMEQYIFPYFSYLESPTDKPACNLHMKFLSFQGKVYMKVNQEELYAWPATQVYKLKGALFMQMLNKIHEGLNEEWMGVIHAASVSLGKRAVMFPARSGGGKSTLASLMMAHGCKLLSDDFTPIALNSGHIHAFPGSISLKAGSLPLMESYFPELVETRLNKSSSKGESIKFLNPHQPEYLTNEGYAVSAIVFVQYDSQKECNLERISNLAAINDFLTESWLPDDALVAEQFLNWFFDIPCYSLHYGNNPKAVDSILTLLKDVT